MSNERLRAAIHQAGLEIDELANTVGASPKTVRRWIAGRDPRGRYRTLVAQALGRTEAELWPELDLQVSGRDERGEILAAYAHTSDLTAPTWQTLLTHATRQIDLLDPTLAHVLDTAGTTQLLTDKATAGCHIRLLISAPDSAHLTLSDAEETGELPIDIPEAAIAAERTIALAAQLVAGSERIMARTFITARPHTILRFDDELLASLHLYATDREQAPLLHLQRHSDHGLFHQFAEHYEAIWQDAQPIPSAPTA